MHFCKNAGRGYMNAVAFVNACWSYLFSCEWCRSSGDVLPALVLLVELISVTPFTYLCVAPFMAFFEGTR